MDYSRLAARLREPDCTGKSDAEVAEYLNAPSTVETFDRFGSLRTLAELLTALEYAALKAALVAAADGQPLVADMMEMLKTPGDECGNGGGVNFGSSRFAEVLAEMVQNGLDSAIAAKITAYAQRPVSVVEALGIGRVTDGDVAFVRCNGQQGA